MANDPFKKHELAIIKGVSESLTTRELKPVAEELADDIRVRTRLGKGVERYNGPEIPLKGLSPSYKQQRAGKIGFAKNKQGKTYPYKPGKKGRRHPSLSDKTTPNKSNLTFTGQMLDSLSGKSPKKGTLEVYFDSKRTGRLTNSDVARFAEENPGQRKFFNLSSKQVKRFEDEMTSLITRNIDKELTKI